ncbi:MAG: hypothetical protein LBE35_05935 [Clostridiales bacterium]|jgi:hypothetical protein|nr:hypothetical protein [Clostridiales bacterium]
MRPARLRPQKGGHGHVTSFAISVGIAEVRSVGFLNSDNTPKPIIKIIDEANGQIVIKLAQKEGE